MSATHDKTKLYASNPAGGACSDELFRAHSRRRPLPGLAQAGQHHQTSLDIKEKMSQKMST